MSPLSEVCNFALIEYSIKLLYICVEFKDFIGANKEAKYGNQISEYFPIGL